MMQKILNCSTNQNKRYIRRQSFATSLVPVLSVLCGGLFVDVDRLWSDHNRLEYYTDDDGEVQRARVIFAEDEQISLALQLSPE